MINVKLIVLLTWIDIVFGNSYCKICLNHTLCKYTMPGPADSCKLYDKRALLTDNDIKEIIKKLNERRNYVAMGYSKFLPAAANMRKISWSEELASFAQRWVDQCDQSLRPDNEDQCRNRSNEAVGQNIATIIGASSFNVKSFVDTWFIKILDYSGSVSYYNQSLNTKTKYFTQLIWADTNFVGCGRARFYADHKSSMVERLVCNFAPQGNLHKKPVYAIGYPATQCPDNTRPDEIYKGLCRYIEQNDKSTLDKERNTTSSSPKVSSLLRILNLSNSSAKQAIDPLRNNFKPFKPNINMTAEQRYQKIRHIENNTYGSINGGMKQHNVNPLHMTNMRFYQKMITATQGQEQKDYYQERGHSRVYHGDHVHKIKELSTQTENTEQYYRRYNIMTEIFDINYSPDFRKHNNHNQCSRKVATTQCNTEQYYPQVRCTRRPNRVHDEPQHSDQTMRHEDLVPHELCQCNIPKSSCTTPISITTKCTCNINCQCLNHPTIIYPNHLRKQELFSDDARKYVTSIDYYEQFPNVGVRRGEKNSDNRNRKIVFPFQKVLQLNNDELIRTERQSSLYTKKYNHGNVKNNNDYMELYEDNIENRYKKPFTYQRYKRNSADELTFKPFWQMDELIQNQSPELKSLRYTTLSNKRHKVSYRKPSIITESITIKLGENNELNRKIVTEKYLSFDELMHLRKFGETEIDIYGARRTTKKAAATTKATTKAAGTTKATVKTTHKAGATTKATAKTVQKVTATTKATTKPTTKTTTKSSIITANTPFERKKHCTRKLTCTWTAATVTGADGSVIGGMEIEVGSLTPEGYVDGCTRTSTCTRIYMHKNKFSTLGEIEDEGSGAAGDESLPHGDEDYCEKRALDIRRRESGEEYFNGQATNTISQVSSPTSFQKYEMNTEKNHYTHFHNLDARNDCECEENFRVKRNEIPKNDPNKVRESLSYGDLYYRVLKKILSDWRNYHPSDKHKCACNNGFYNAAKYSLIIVLFLII